MAGDSPNDFYMQFHADAGASGIRLRIHASQSHKAHLNARIARQQAGNLNDHPEQGWIEVTAQFLDEPTCTTKGNVLKPVVPVSLTLSLIPFSSPIVKIKRSLHDHSPLRLNAFSSFFECGLCPRITVLPDSWVEATSSAAEKGDGNTGYL